MTWQLNLHRVSRYERNPGKSSDRGSGKGAHRIIGHVLHLVIANEGRGHRKLAVEVLRQNVLPEISDAADVGQDDDVLSGPHADHMASPKPSVSIGVWMMALASERSSCWSIVPAQRAASTFERPAERSE